MTLLIRAACAFRRPFKTEVLPVYFHVHVFGIVGRRGLVAVDAAGGELLGDRERVEHAGSLPRDRHRRTSPAAGAVRFSARIRVISAADTNQLAGELDGMGGGPAGGELAGESHAAVSVYFCVRREKAAQRPGGAVRPSRGRCNGGRMVRW